MNTKLSIALGLTLVSALTMGVALSAPHTEAFQNILGRESPFHSQERPQWLKGEVTHEITKLDNGVQITLTSDNAEMIQKLQSRNHEARRPMNNEISRIQENISNGVKITISSDDPDLIKKIQDHAENPPQRMDWRRGKGNKRGNRTSLDPQENQQ